MKEEFVYGLFFAAILLNYVAKLGIERKGGQAPRSHVRDWIICGALLYCLCRVILLSDISTSAAIVILGLGAASLTAWVAFFIKGIRKRGGDS